MNRKTVALAGLFLLWMLTVGILVLHKQKGPREAPAPAAASQPIDDEFWLNLDRRREDKYRQQLRAAPPLLVVRESHYAFNPTNGMGAHYGWLDGKLANLHISFSELVAYAYGGNYARTEFPRQWTRGQLTNKFDVIATVTNHPQDALQAEARRFLRQQFGLTWHTATRTTEVLVLRAKDPELLESKTDVDFEHRKSIPELVFELENYFSKPVINETGATNRYDKSAELVPARWVNGRTTDLDANNAFLRSFGLELISAKRPQEWLVMEHRTFGLSLPF
jgi:uncharacterized protein (TIGR03435 family)